MTDTLDPLVASLNATAGDYVPAPPLTQFPSGLLLTGAVIDHADDHGWGGGIFFAPENCASVTVLDQYDNGVGGVVAQAPNRPAKETYLPFVGDAYDACSAFQWQTDFQARATRALVARESKAVESEFWSGTKIPANAHLTQFTTVTNGPQAYKISGGASVSLRVGLALLVQAAADLNLGDAMIHCRPLIAELWGGLQLVGRDGRGQLRTACGLRVVAGSGYPGTGPDGAAISSSSEWAMVSDPVTIHRGPISTPSLEDGKVWNLDRATNTIAWRAQRLYAPIFGGCGIGAVNLDPTSTGL